MLIEQHQQMGRRELLTAIGEPIFEEGKVVARVGVPEENFKKEQSRRKRWRVAGAVLAGIPAIVGLADHLINPLSASADNAVSCYTVFPGERLSAIAANHQITLRRLVDLNRRDLSVTGSGVFYAHPSQKLDLTPGGCGAETTQEIDLNNIVAQSENPISAQPEPRRVLSGARWVNEKPHPEYSWDLNGDGIWYVDHQNGGVRSMYVECGRQNECLTWPKTEPTGYLTWATRRQDKYVVQYQEGPGTGNHHGVSLDLGNNGDKKPVNIFWNEGGDVMGVDFANGEKAYYKITGLPGYTGDRGKWNGIFNGRIEAVITEGIRADQIPHP